MPQLENGNRHANTPERSKIHELEKRIKYLEDLCLEMKRVQSTMIRTLAAIQKRSNN
jgi:hypothetical protein